VLAVSKDPTPIRNFEELLDSKKYSPVLKNGVNLEYFKFAPNGSTGTKMWLILGSRFGIAEE
jgi:hypothetical protein